MLTRDEVCYLYRSLFNRMPESEEAIEATANTYQSFEEARNYLLYSEEFYLIIKDRLSDFSATYCACDFPRTVQPFMPQGTGLALCAIMKNEAQSIARMLTSSLPIVEFISLVDTGSDDGSIEVAEALLRKSNIPFVIDSIDFLDFSTSRNHALERVPSHLRWILCLDADEYLVEEDYPRLLALIDHDYGIDGWRLPRYNFRDSLGIEKPYLYPDYQKRLLRNRPDIRFAGLVHEWVYNVRRWGFAPVSEIAQGGSCGGPHIHHTALIHPDSERAARKYELYRKLWKQHTGSEMPIVKI